MIFVKGQISGIEPRKETQVIIVILLKKGAQKIQ